MPSPHSTIVLHSTGHDWGKPALNAAGYVYAVFIILYTLALITGLALLYHHRAKPAVRVRGLFITIAAVLGIHVYVAALFIVYPLNGWYKCGTEFWYMSIVFPLGVALFHVGNVKLMTVAKKQQGLLRLACWAEEKPQPQWNVAALTTAMKNMDYVQKTYLGIAAGLLVQVC